VTAQTTVYDSAGNLDGKPFLRLQDVWSLGVTMVEALSQRAPVGREKLFYPILSHRIFADIAAALPGPRSAKPLDSAGNRIRN